MKCYYCNDVGHYKNERPLRDNKDAKRSESHYIDNEVTKDDKEVDDEVNMLYCYHIEDEEGRDKNTITSGHGLNHIGLSKPETTNECQKCIANNARCNQRRVLRLQ